MERAHDAGLLMRQLLAGVLAASVVVLAVLYVAKPRSGGADESEESAWRQGAKEIDAVIDTMVGRHGIPPEWVRTWRVKVPGTPFFRVERRIWVPREFVVLRFNHELDQQLSGYGAKVVGLERTVQGTVTLHVIHNGVVVESLSFVPKSDLEKGS
jgi:hypothetical protein